LLSRPEFDRTHDARPDMHLPGMKRGTMIKTGERTFCLVGEWDSMESIVAARPSMITMLDRVRGDLEDLGGGLGVTDPISGQAVLELG
jgi:hypothetical protein